MISFSKVTKTYPRTSTPALDAVSLDVGRGDFVFLVGSSGSGKSTFLRLVLREDVGQQARAALAAEAERLTGWLDGVRITNVYASPQMRGAVLP